MTAVSLVGRAAAGDARAWTQLVRDLTDIPWGIARALGLPREDAASIVTVTWLRLVDRLDRFGADDQVRHWLAVTAYQEAKWRLPGSEALRRGGVQAAASRVLAATLSVHRSAALDDDGPAAFDGDGAHVSPG